MRWSVAAGLAIGAALLVLALSADRLSGRWASGRLSGVAEFGRAVRGLLSRPVTAIPIIGVSVVVHLAAGVTDVADRGQPGAVRGLVDCLVLMPPIVLVAGMPLSIAGWGLREGAMVAVFALVGVPMDGALLMSVLLGLLLLLVSLPGGLVLVFSEFRTVEAAVRPPHA